MFNLIVNKVETLSHSQAKILSVTEHATSIETTADNAKRAKLLCSALLFNLLCEIARSSHFIDVIVVLSVYSLTDLSHF
ncbi:hypothetical protein IB691_01975 [Fangia hongkongensis]|nr:hypothetical protein [Fangia hongkongensis]